MTLENKLEFDLPVWNGVSDTCKDLIKRLLNKNPAQRISLEDALSHKWFENVDINSKTGTINKNKK